MIGAIAAIASAVLPSLTSLFSEVVEDKDKANELAYKAATLVANTAHENALAQVSVNLEEAKHSSVFVAGWRPYIGWVCGMAMAFNYIIVPIAGIWLPIHALDITTMFPVLLGMLGLSGLRTREREKGVSREADPRLRKGG